jgi:hypothetical protein
LGMVVIILAFDWALILITSLVGATIITEHLTVQESLRSTLFVLAVLSGILVQYLTGKERPDENVVT